MSKDKFMAAIDVLMGSSQKPINKRNCELCHAPKSVGKYFVEDEGDNVSGWCRVCTQCAEMVSRLGSEVHYYKYTQEYKNQEYAESNPLPDCDHEWDKHSLVSQVDKKRDDVFDWMKCTKCNCYGKRFGVGQYGILDLTMEIDLNCTY